MTFGIPMLLHSCDVPLSHFRLSTRGGGAQIDPEIMADPLLKEIEESSRNIRGTAGASEGVIGPKMTSTDEVDEVQEGDEISLPYTNEILSTFESKLRQMRTTIEAEMDLEMKDIREKIIKKKRRRQRRFELEQQSQEQDVQISYSEDKDITMISTEREEKASGTDIEEEENYTIGTDGKSFDDEIQLDDMNQPILNEEEACNESIPVEDEEISFLVGETDETDDDVLERLSSEVAFNSIVNDASDFIISAEDESDEEDTKETIFEDGEDIIKKSKRKKKMRKKTKTVEGSVAINEGD